MSEPERGISATDFDPIAEAKRLLRGTRTGSLATLTNSGDPFATLVTVATDPGGSPLILISQLSAHTRHLGRDARVSLLLAETGEGDPLAHPRITITGMAAKMAEPETRSAVKARFLARHPKAELYADFADFSFWRIAMEQIHLNGGFARAARFPADRIVTSVERAAALIAAEAEAIAHMNADHVDTLTLYAEVIAGKPPGAWIATGLDPDGMDLAWGDLTARVPFAEPITNPSDLRKALVRMAHAARGSV